MMNWIKKNLKWIILVITALIIAIIAFIDYKQIYVALTLIPSVLLSFLQSNNEKQEKLAEMQITEKEKEEKQKQEESRMENMVKTIFRIGFTVYSNEETKKKIKFENQEINISNIFENKPRTTIEEIFCKILLINLDNNNEKKKLYTFFNYYNYYNYNYNSTKIYNTIMDSLEKYNTEGKKYIDILKQELPKILTPDVFDGENLIIKDDKK